MTNNKRHKSQNVRNQEMRDTKMLQNFNKYQQIWQSNLNQFEEVRNKLNDKALSKNAKLNYQQSINGDLTILDRIDQHVEKQKNRDLLTIALRPNHDHGLDWYSSLR